MAEGGERGRSWYLSKEEIEQGSPSRKDGMPAAREAHLRSIYSSYIRDVGRRLGVPDITIATGIVLCHRFYLHQSLLKNEWQTVATACIFLASKIEDTPCQLGRVVTVAHETMYKRKPDAARRIKQKEVLEKRKDLILMGEALLLSTIRFDFNIQHPYEPLNLALKNLGISQKEVKQAAINLINDTLRTTLVVQFKPHYIAAGALHIAAKFHDVTLPSEQGKVWWHQFDVAPKQLQAAIQQMKQVFNERNQRPAGPAIGPIQAPAPVEKQQAVRFPKPALVAKQQTLSLPKPAPVAKQQTLSLLKPAPVEEQQAVSFLKPAPLAKQQIVSSQKPAPVEEHQTVRSPKPAPLEEQQTVSSLKPALVEERQTVSFLKPAPLEEQQTVSFPKPAPVEKQQTVSSLKPAPAEKQQTVNSPKPAPVEKQQIISFPMPVLKYTYSRRGLRNTTAPTVTPTPTLVKKQQKISTPDGPVSHAFSPRGVLNGPTSAPTITPNPMKKQQALSTLDSVQRQAHPSVGGVKRTRSPAQDRTLVKKQKIISAPNSVVRHARPSVVVVRPTGSPARARTPVKKSQIISAQDSVPRHTRPSVGGERRPSTAPAPTPASALARKHPTISTPDSVLRHTDPSRNEDSKPLRMHVDHSLSRTAKDGRLEKPSFQAALNANHGHHVGSGPKDVNMTRVPNLVGQKRRIQEAAGQPPAPADRCAGDASRRPQLPSLIVAPPSWKKQKIDV
ncbi:cyclin-T1-1-like [Triticum dicoccoides]|uniref:cyclin-T1-1-like n=1 Tax=Triticum dicoccoides TaxID=85692 RepID=UPI00189154DF|nr:cyclin-T1-1-like [Triticum dicoccoides]